MSDDIPETLQLAKSLANSVDVETGADDLASLEKAQAWVNAHGFGAVHLGDRELARLRAFREGLRALLIGNHGDPVDVAAVAAMNDAAMGTALAVTFDSDGVPKLEATGSGIDRIFAEVQRGIAAAAVDGSWERLKICRNDTCAVAFYDRSKNRSRSWCSMDVCGNRMKARTFRQKHSETKS